MEFVIFDSSGRPSTALEQQGVQFAEKLRLPYDVADYMSTATLGIKSNEPTALPVPNGTMEIVSHDGSSCEQPSR